MSGDSAREERFDRIYDRLRREAYAILFASTHDREAAADGVQETFVRIWRRLDAIAPADERAYVLRTARSVAIDASRRRKSRVDPAPGLDIERSTDPGPDWERRWELDRLDAAIAALPDDEREAFVMTVMGGLESGEVGRMIGKPPGTVRYLVHQARARIERTIAAQDATTEARTR